MLYFARARRAALFAAPRKQFKIDFGAAELWNGKTAMNIAIVGTGYVGLVSGACFAEMGVNVFCIDIDEKKIQRLQKGDIPIYEPNLDTLVLQNIKNGRLHFTTDLSSILDNVEIVFTAVGTPPDEDGSADLSYVLNVAHTVGRNMNKYVLVVTKSTVPVGTAEKVRAAIKGELDKRGLSIDFDVASNPEFLKEGSAIEDFSKPDRIIIGVDSERAKKLMTSLYKPILLNNFRAIFMDIASAEMAKYAANAMLATRISFMNDIANLCERLGANVDMVRAGIGSDSRIGSKFLRAGCGYGGSCFPKDVKALLKTAKDSGYEMRVLDAVERVNESQKHVLFQKLRDIFGDNLKGLKVAIWGLSFKPGTDDMREATSLVLIKELLDAGCDITACDPAAVSECKRRIGENTIKYASDIYECSKGANVIFHITEWKEFRLPNWSKIKSLMAENPVLIDGRNVFTDSELCGIRYERIGHKIL